MPQSTAWFGMTAASSRNVERRGSRRHHAPYVVGRAPYQGNTRLNEKSRVESESPLLPPPTVGVVRVDSSRLRVWLQSLIRVYFMNHGV